MAAIARVDGIVVAAFEVGYLVPMLGLVAALLLGALIIAVVRHWQRSSQSLGPDASDQLAHFRSLYEQGAISEEEYKRLRKVLGGELRRSLETPARQPDAIQSAPTPPSPPRTDAPPADPHQPPLDGVPPP
jgi:hypothetical protein